jgi:hypothetical protein
MRNPCVKTVCESTANVRKNALQPASRKRLKAAVSWVMHGTPKAEVVSSNLAGSASYPRNKCSLCQESAALSGRSSTRSGTAIAVPCNA